MNTPILLKSNFYRIDSWKTDNRGHVKKSRAKLFKHLLPGDYLIFSTKLEALGGSYTCKFKVTAFRNDKKIGETQRSQNQISNIIDMFFKLTEIKNSTF